MKGKTSERKKNVKEKGKKAVKTVSREWSLWEKRREREKLENEWMPSLKRMTWRETEKRIPLQKNERGLRRRREEK